MSRCAVSLITNKDGIMGHMKILKEFSVDDFGDSSELILTPRELAIAKIAAEKAAELATEKIIKNFYQEVGQTVIKRFLIIVGALVVGYLSARGIKL